MLNLQNDLLIEIELDKYSEFLGYLGANNSYNMSMVKAQLYIDIMSKKVLKILPFTVIFKLYPWV